MISSIVHVQPEHTGNHLLACLPDAIRMRWDPHLQQVELALGQVLYEAQSRFSYVSFPLTAVVSLAL